MDHNPVIDTRWEPMVIFAVDDEAAFHASDKSRDCKPLEGCYKGVPERSWIASAGHFFGHCLPFITGQESILVLDGMSANGYKWQRFATLRYAPADGWTPNAAYAGRREPLGWFTAVPEDVAKARDAWTLDPETRTFWICTPDGKVPPVVDDTTPDNLHAFTL